MAPGPPWAPGLSWCLLGILGSPGLPWTSGLAWGRWALPKRIEGPHPKPSLLRSEIKTFPWDPQRSLKLPLGVGPEPQRRPKCVKVFARGCLGVVVVLEMAARACLGHTGAFKFAARAFLGAAGAFEVAAPGLPRNRKGVRNGCSRLRRSLTLLCAPFSCMDMHGFTLHAYV